MILTTKQLFCFSLLYVALFLSRPANSQTTNFDVEVSSDYSSIIASIALPGNRLGIIAFDNTATNVFLSVFNASGVKIGTTDITARFSWPHTTHGGVSMSAIATSDGNIFIAYWANTNSSGIQTYNARYILITDSGSLLAGGQLNNNDALNEYLFQIKLDKLSDGKIVALWLRGKNNNLVFRLFNADGSAFANEVAFAGAGTVNPITNLYTFKLAAGKNGNFMASVYYFNGNLRGFVFDNSGVNAINGGATSFNVDATVNNNYSNNGLVGLANGNFVTAWSLSGSNYIEVIAPDGSIVVAKQTLPNTYISGMIPDYTSGSEGFIIAEILQQAPGSMTNPLATAWISRYNQAGVLQSSTAAPEGALVQPTYTFTAGTTGGYAYLYTYFRSFTIMPFPMNMAMPSGDNDTKGVLQGFSLSTLPVVLISFDATLLGNQEVLLSWKTASETNNSHYQIEKSNDSRNFYSIGLVTGKGNSGIESSYSFTDREKVTGIAYYRLKQFDADGNWKSLGIKALKAATRAIAASAYPNPVKGNKITVLTGNEPLPASYSLTDMQGRMIRSGILRQAKEDLNLPLLQEGIYILQIGANNRIKIKK